MKDFLFFMYSSERTYFNEMLNSDLTSAPFIAINMADYNDIS